MPKTDRAPAPLAAFEGRAPDAPDWFARALQAPVETGRTKRPGGDIAWKGWGTRGAPALTLIHGGVAHKGWWDAIAPFLAAQGRRVVAIDLAGMGESGWREVYTMADHARDVRAATEEAGAFEAGKPLIVGHSFGGFVALQCALDHGEALRGAAVLDSPVRSRAEQRSEAPPRRGGRAYKDLTAALARFRLLPEQACANLWLVDHIARASIKQTDAGFTWRFDPDLWARLAYEPRDPDRIAAATRCPLAFVRGAQSSLVTDAVWRTMKSAFGKSAFPDAPFITVPEAEHHLLLDQPLTVAGVLETLFESWAR